MMFALTVDCECWWCKHGTIEEDCQYLVHHRFPFGHEILKGWNLILNRYPCLSLVQEVEDIPEDAKSEEGPLVSSSKWSAFCECLCVP